ncbi:division/cell wall cluster transcriptional repressor MraZ [Bacteroidota bacterium]
MSRFKGEETYSIDSKGRVNIPAKMRKNLSPDANDIFVVTRGFEKCIYAYPMDEWKKKEESYEGLSEYEEKNRFFLRMLLRYSQDVKMDGQQRIALPKELIGFAGIDKKTTVAGVMNHLEFWDPDEYEKYMKSHKESYEDVAERLMTGKI